MMAYKEEDYLMLSGIQHFMFCRRQWGLIHVEQEWEENVRTVEGQYLHKKTDQPIIREKRKNKLIVRALPVHSTIIGVSGICDVVEFVEHPDGIQLKDEIGSYMPYPVEYKRGKPKKDLSDVLQLTAQAICLEEMLVCEIRRGALFYNETKHREEIEFTDELREQVTKTFAEMHQYFKKRYTPKAKQGPHCKNCSLINVCLPSLSSKQSVTSYIERRLGE